MKRTIMALVLVLVFGIFGGCVMYLPCEWAEDTAFHGESQPAAAAMEKTVAPVTVAPGKEREKFLCSQGYRCQIGHYDQYGHLLCKREACKKDDLVHGVLSPNKDDAPDVYEWRGSFDGQGNYTGGGYERK